MRKWDLPIVVRQTLNDVAFDAKKRTLPLLYGSAFKGRQKSFLKWSSTATPAKGLSMDSMSSSIGILDKGRKATDNIAKHEYGGKTPDKIYETEESRVGKDWDRGVKSAFKLKKHKGKFGKRIRTGQNGRFIKEAHKKVGGFVRYENTVYKVSKGSGNELKFTRHYIMNNGTHHKAKPTNFLGRSMDISIKDKLHRSFRKRANARLKL